MFGNEAKQTITVRASISTVTLWQASLLPAFIEAYPGINVRLVSTIWGNSIAEEDVDIDLRIGYGDWPGMQAEKISTETVVPVSALDGNQSIGSSTDLLQQPHIYILGHEDSWETYLSTHGLVAESSHIRYMVDTTATALALAAAGGGIAIIITRFVDAAIHSGCAVSVVGDPVEFPQSHYFVNPVNQSAPRPEVRLLKSWIRSVFDESVGGLR
ncbi:hypothetical protein AB833_08595 [Chromatiales bacterium (ex Bugula neritina AB1)]|nr:hypothetical protein AB833_08595 [Chromatiales bacterium (ex Bugula neritina AB1)]